MQDYLKYYGYGDTLHAFDQAAGLTDPVASTSGRYAVVPKHSECDIGVLHSAHELLRTLDLAAMFDDAVMSHVVLCVSACDCGAVKQTNELSDALHSHLQLCKTVHSKSKSC